MKNYFYVPKKILKKIGLKEIKPGTIIYSEVYHGKHKHI